MAKNDLQKWPKMAKNGPKWPKMTGNVQERRNDRKMDKAPEKQTAKLA